MLLTPINESDGEAAAGICVELYTKAEENDPMMFGRPFPFSFLNSSEAENLVFN